ncbi:hypothetical protein ACFY8W_12605 [Streptomyces sp. NPDC012637]|uniref:hypothetical protein n=1 Tax=Streptomyces sp. NPDC012637 TaxID=3364842 RepID=UPI0036EDC4AB
MMPQPHPKRVCSHCDGFAVVHVTTGNTTTDGKRRTLPANCPACKGTGNRAHLVRSAEVSA